MNKTIKRTLADIPAEKLKSAIIEMCKKLAIPASYDGYNLYAACENERQKAIEKRKLIDHI